MRVLAAFSYMNWAAGMGPSASSRPPINEKPALERSGALRLTPSRLDSHLNRCACWLDGTSTGWRRSATKILWAPMALAANDAGSGAARSPCASQPAIPPAAKIASDAARRIQPDFLLAIAGGGVSCRAAARTVTISLSTVGTGSSGLDRRSAKGWCFAAGRHAPMPRLRDGLPARLPGAPVDPGSAVRPRIFGCRRGTWIQGCSLDSP